MKEWIRSNYDEWVKSRINDSCVRESLWKRYGKKGIFEYTEFTPMSSSDPALIYGTLYKLRDEEITELRNG